MNEVELKAKKASYMREWRKKHPEYNELHRLKMKEYWKTPVGKEVSRRHAEKQKIQGRNKAHHRIWKMSDENLEKMYIEHNYRCAICNDKKDKLVIDHNHRTNKIRGLLCGNCNSAIGFMKENIQTLNNAINYLTKSEDIKCVQS